jgi:AGZA family xanthine/uracil permease-like MFS transporter
MDYVRRSVDNLNNAVGRSTFGRIFRLEGSGHVCDSSPNASETCSLTLIKDFEIKNTRFTTEVRAGLTSFFTMAYIIAVNVIAYPTTSMMLTDFGRLLCYRILAVTVYATIPPVTILSVTRIRIMIFAFKVKYTQTCTELVSHISTDLNRSLITATAALAGFSSFLFGFMTNMPVCLG